MQTLDEYSLVLTLTDGRLGLGNYVTQSMLVLVEDINDNAPVFKPYQSSITVREDAAPGVVATLEAVDADEGAYGQVVYYMQGQSDGGEVFTVTTNAEMGIVRLVGEWGDVFQSHFTLTTLSRFPGLREANAVRIESVGRRQGEGRQNQHRHGCPLDKSGRCRRQTSGICKGALCG